MCCVCSTVVEDTAENDAVHRHAVITTPKSAKLESHVEPNRTWGLFKGIAGIFRLVIFRHDISL